MSANRVKGFGTIKILALVAILIVAAIIALPFILDANSFKSEVEARLTSALGRTTKIGNLKLALFSGGIAADDITIADDPSFSKSPFVRAKSLQVNVELMPLIFSKALHITGIILDKPEIALIRSESGVWNFSGIGCMPTSQPSSKANEKGSGSSAADIKISMLKIIDGRLTVARQEGGAKPYVYDKVNLNALDLSFAAVFPFTLTATLPGSGTASLDGKAGPINLVDTSLTPFNAALDVARFDLIASGFIEPGSGIAGVIDFNGNVSSDSKLLQSQGKAKAVKLQIAKGSAPAGRPLSINYALTHNLINQTGTLSNTRIELGKAEAQLSCSYDMHGKSTILKAKLRGENMPVEELEAFLPAVGVTLPEGSSLQGGTLAADLASEGLLENLVTKGTVGLFNTRLIGFDLGAKMAVVAKLAGLKPNAATEIEKLTIDAQATQERIQVNDLLLVVPALGQMRGNGIIGSDSSLDFKMLANLNVSGGVVGSLVSLAGSANSKGLAVPFFIRGTALKPTFVPDVKGATGGLLESFLSGKKSKEGESNQAPSLGNTLRNLLKKKESEKKKGS